MSLPFCLCTTTLDTPSSGDGGGPCDREDDRRGDLCFATLLSIMSKYSIKC